VPGLGFSPDKMLQGACLRATTRSSTGSGRTSAAPVNRRVARSTITSAPGAMALAHGGGATSYRAVVPQGTAPRGSGTVIPAGLSTDRPCAFEPRGAEDDYGQAATSIGC